MTDVDDSPVVRRAAALGGTSTHALRLDGLRLPDEDVVLLADRGPWAQVDVVHGQAAHVRAATLAALVP